MREFIQVMLTFAPGQAPKGGRLQKELAARGLSIETRKSGFTIELDSEPEFRKVLSLFEASGFNEESCLVRRRREYAYDDLAAAKLLLLESRDPLAPGGPSRGARYDLSRACPVCGSGAIQLTSLAMNPAELAGSTDLLQLEGSETIVSHRLANRLLEEAVEGLSFRDVLSSVTGQPLPWSQMIVRPVLPPMSSTTKGVVQDRRCNRCKRNGYFWDSDISPTEIHYDLSEGAIPDIATSYEWFGSGALQEPFEDTILAWPLLMMKPKVFHVLSEHTLTGIGFAPVLLDPTGGEE